MSARRHVKPNLKGTSEGRKPNKNSLNHYRSLDGIGNIEKPLKLVAGDLDSGLLRAQHDEAAA
ncbi:MAG TPA: hypothetical protein VJS43_10010, partial [Candidatus Acidoferrales bacterium]|nr:hypothetical protein [Candidatus Acidoferrales bacterium]